MNYSRDLKPLGGAHDLLSWTPVKRNKVRLVAGHMPFGLDQQLAGPSHYITILRDPITRVVSDYYFCRKNRDNPAYPPARDLPLAEFVRQGHAHSHNCYVRWLSNSVFGAQFSSDGDMLDVAMRNLARFSFVGITECFEESVMRLCTKFGLVRHAARSRNRNASSPANLCLTREEEEIITTCNMLDLQIYRDCREQFETTCTQS